MTHIQSAYSQAVWKVEGGNSVMAMMARLPGNITLAVNEQVVATTSLMFSLSQFFLHHNVVLTNRRLAGESPNTLLGLIPTGSRKFSYPLENIASVTTSTQLGILRILLGLVILLFGLAAVGQSAVLGIVLVILGALLFLAVLC